jgi:hypothetical protein
MRGGAPDGELQLAVPVVTIVNVNGNIEYTRYGRE